MRSSCLSAVDRASGAFGHHERAILWFGDRREYMIYKTPCKLVVGQVNKAAGFAQSLMALYLS